MPVTRTDVSDWEAGETALNCDPDGKYEYNAAGRVKNAPTTRQSVKDKDGYGYRYDYENRIVEVNDSNGTTVVEFAYTPSAEALNDSRTL